MSEVLPSLCCRCTPLVSDLHCTNKEEGHIEMNHSPCSVGLERRLLDSGNGNGNGNGGVYEVYEVRIQIKTDFGRGGYKLSLVFDGAM